MKGGVRTWRTVTEVLPLTAWVRLLDSCQTLGFMSRLGDLGDSLDWPKANESVREEQHTADPGKGIAWMLTLRCFQHCLASRDVTLVDVLGLLSVIQ